MSKVLVTGGAGFIGSHLVDRLITDGHDVQIIDNLSTGDRANVNPRAKFIGIDICDRKAIDAYADYECPEFIFHLAAQINLRHSFTDPANDAHINIVGSLNVISIAKKCDSKVLFASTGGAIYSSKSNTPWHTTSKINPKSPYGMNKYMVEKYLEMLKVKHSILRLSNVYGPRQNHKGEAGVIAIFINNVLNNEDLTIFGNGKQERDFIYVDDVVNAFMVCMCEDDRYNRTRNVGTGTGTDITTIAHMILDGMGADKEIRYTKAIPGELKKSILNSWWGYQRPGPWRYQVALDDGIARTIKYFV